jgi:hypothetical protein
MFQYEGKEFSVLFWPGEAEHEDGNNTATLQKEKMKKERKKEEEEKRN